MNKEEAKEIIKLLQPQMNNVEYRGKRADYWHYRAYLYVIHFYFQEQEYILRMYMLENTAEILKIHTKHFIDRNGDERTLENWEHVISEDEVPYEIRKEIIRIQGE